MLSPRLQLKVSQKQILTPGLVQMVTVLQLNRLELKDMITQEIAENPVLEESVDGIEELTPEEVDILIRTIRDLVRTLGIRRLVLDSLTSVCYRIRKDEQIRDFMLRLGQELNDAGCTSLLVSEIGPTPGRYSLHGVEEAIVDGVVLLWNTRRMGDILRVLQIVKMRGTAHSRAQYVMELTPIGILMAPHLKGGREGGQ